MSVNNVNPTTLFGGTWISWGSGRVPVGVDTSQTEFNTVEKTGGEKTHQLTVNEMPSHTHALNNGNPGGNIESWNGNYFPANSETNRTYGYEMPVGFAGGDQPHNNLQPYITCYMWKRTA